MLYVRAHIEGTMSWKEFLLEVFGIYRGTLVSKVVLAVITLAATLLA